MWKVITEKRYDEFLSMLPPAYQTGKGFLVGEQFSSRKCKITGKVSPTYLAFMNAFARYWEGPAMTLEEFKAFKRDDLPDSP